MRPNLFSWTPAAASLTGFASNVTGAGPWVMTATTSGDNLAHLVTVRNDSATNHSAKTLTLTGTDINGDTQTESMAAPAGSATVTSTKQFMSLSTVTISATIGADTFDVGWSQSSVSGTYPIDWRSPYAANIYVDITGTINFTVNQSFANVFTENVPASAYTAISALSAKSADTYGNPAIGATSIQFQVNTVTAGATVTMYFNQATAEA